MTEKTKENWVTTKVRRTLEYEIEKALRGDEAKKEGLTNKAQFVDYAIRKLLTRLEVERMSHLNMYDDHVKILDNRLGKLGRIVSVYFKRDGKPYCDYCKETDCVHVQYAWELPEAGKVLERYGLKPPPSRV